MRIVSTDFDGKRDCPCRDAPPAPLGVYDMSKQQGERDARESLVEGVLIV